MNQDDAMPPEEFHKTLKSLRSSYHLEHPFQILMNDGKLNHEQIRGWVANRFYYQACIPRKDAAILANCTDTAVRRVWVQRILDQDGTAGDNGGIEAWLKLGEACGLPRQELLNHSHVLPGVRFSVDAYLNFAKTAPWQDAICASLTELFAWEAHQARLEAFPKFYPWIAEEGLAYFRRRLGECRRDVDFGLSFTLGYFTSKELQEKAVNIIKFKMDVLWSLLDAIHLHYVVGK